MEVKSTRLRFVSSPSPEGLGTFINALPFKVEIKSIVPRETTWFCWLVLPDNIDDKTFNALGKASQIDMPSINLEDF